ncbi:MAG: HAD-IIIA family hydrolase [Candidatus Paceibacterota bacterium]
MNKALFLDRDGIINKMVYNQEFGLVDTPARIQDIELVFGISDLLKLSSGLGFLNIIISNQPTIGLKKISKAQFETVRKAIIDKLKQDGAVIDGEYYCLHHPFAKNSKYRSDCDCRKPKLGLIQQAKKVHNIDLNKSWFLGDGVNDIIAGHNAGCRTILLGHGLETGYLQLIKKHLGKIIPDFIIKKLPDAIRILKENSL